MSNIVPTTEIKEMARSMGPLFNKKPEEMFALMLIAQAEGKHPAIAAQEYDIIQGRPAINSRSAQARFQASGGKVEWIKRDDAEVSAKFSHPSGGELVVTWNMKRAAQANLTGKDNWKKYPAQMLSARVIAEGVRAVFPACLSGMYTTDEVADFEPMKRVAPENLTPVNVPEPVEEPEDDDLDENVLDNYLKSQDRIRILVEEKRDMLTPEQIQYAEDRIEITGPKNTAEAVAMIKKFDNLYNLIVDSLKKKMEDKGND